MAGCIPCFIIPLLLFLFHRFIQPIILRFWNPWAKKESEENAGGECKSLFSCPCLDKNKKNETAPDTIADLPNEGSKLKTN